VVEVILRKLFTRKEVRTYEGVTELTFWYARELCTIWREGLPGEHLEPVRDVVCFAAPEEVTIAVVSLSVDGTRASFRFRPPVRVRHDPRRERVEILKG